MLRKEPKENNTGKLLIVISETEKSKTMTMKTMRMRTTKQPITPVFREMGADSSHVR